MPIDPVTGRYEPTTSVDNPSGQLGKDDFLKIFAAQLANQDPADPNSPDYMQQMATFSMLEQLTNLSVAQQKAVHASNVGLIGKTVSYLDEDGNAGQGVVQSITFDQAGEGKGDTLTIGGVSGIPVDSLTGVS